MSREPLSRLGMLVRRIVVGDGVDQLARLRIPTKAATYSNLIPATIPT
jgi:hypothetical protein